MTPEDYIRLRNNAQSLLATVEGYWDKTVMPKEKELRSASFADLRPGIVVYYPHYDPPHWQEVVEVREDVAFKAYVAYDGCRYGLEGAYVRKT